MADLQTIEAVAACIASNLGEDHYTPGYVRQINKSLGWTFERADGQTVVGQRLSGADMETAIALGYRWATSLDGRTASETD